MRPRTAVIVPCFKRPEYTLKCIKALENAQDYDNVMFFLIDDGSNDATERLLRDAQLPKRVIVNEENKGLRSSIINFFEDTKDYEFISKVDNDCLVPKCWLDDILKKFEDTDAEVLSPNVLPSNAAYKVGFDDTDGRGYRSSKEVGGLWTMRRSLIDDMYFELIKSRGILMAFNIIKQICVEKKPRVGWLEDVTFQDIGHWSGHHPEHIKNAEHKAYSQFVGRRTAW